jgi:hypothetical protein
MTDFPIKNIFSSKFSIRFDNSASGIVIKTENLCPREPFGLLLHHVFVNDLDIFFITVGRKLHEINDIGKLGLNKKIILFRYCLQALPFSLILYRAIGRGGGVVMYNVPSCKCYAAGHW